jgi:hypothetical protein
MHRCGSGCLCWSGRTGTWEQLETVVHHDAIEKHQASERAGWSLLWSLVMQHVGRCHRQPGACAVSVEWCS